MLVGQKTVLLLIDFENYLKSLPLLSEEKLNTDSTKKQVIKSVIGIEIEQALKLELRVYSITEFQNASLELQNLLDTE